MHEKKIFIRSMYTSLAGRYDLTNRVISWGRDRRWRAKAVADLPRRGWIIDLGGGTGDLTKSYFLAGPAGARIVFVDFNREMIRYAKKKFAGTSWEKQISFVIGDVERLPLRSSVFSGAMSAFVLRNLPSVDLIAAETNRVLHAGGEAVFLDATRPPRGWFRKLFDLYFQYVMPRVGTWINYGQGKAYRYLAGSVIELPSTERLIQIFRAAGFKNCRFSRQYRGMATIFYMKKDRPAQRYGTQ